MIGSNIENLNLVFTIKWLEEVESGRLTEKSHGGTENILIRQMYDS